MGLAERAAAIFRKDSLHDVWEKHLFDDCKELDPIEAHKSRYKTLQDACNGAARDIRVIYEHSYIDPQTGQPLDRTIQKFPIPGSRRAEDLWCLFTENELWQHPPLVESSYCNRYTLLGVEVKNNQEVNPLTNKL